MNSEEWHRRMDKAVKRAEAVLGCHENGMPPPAWLPRKLAEDILWLSTHYDEKAQPYP